MTSRATSAIIVGGGIIGCSIAWELARSGIRCTIIDKGALNQEASTAAAGMLGAQVETHQPGAFYELCRLSQRLYRDWSDEVHRISGISMQYIEGGILRAAFDQEDEQELLGRLPWIQNAEWLSAADMLALESGLSPHIRGGLRLAQDHQVHPVHLAEALQAALRKLGCAIREWTPVHSLIERQGRIEGVRTAEGVLFADHVIVSAGAWGSALTEPFGIELPLFPVKGQCISVRTETPAIHSTVFTKSCYIVPKLDGSLTIGATQEEAGFNKQCHISSISELHAKATELVPQLAKAEFIRTWAGLRPGTRDGMPIMGYLTQLPGLVLAMGHYRNGILLAPATGRLIRQLLLNERADLDLAPFSPDRPLQLV
ncbi:glycine oxidase ThiO [Paenibacillus agricola]|uniref:glycine oxidase n=1 Tax=Paenibacillus agricola TaxID=2716264 RepID=A0ABX0J5H6_9BACL|nr:glycine oxidase ThiO [Paenibacillus agricola]NHN31367.1 glycine oxidase ThiO [Paenibacillus agricola]